MNKKEKFEKRVNSFLYNHIWLKYFIEYGIAFIATAFSAAIFAFGVSTFLEPASLSESLAQTKSMVSGGASGLSQVISLIFSVFGIKSTKNPRLIFSIAYIVINTPLVIIAFKGVGKRFGIFTMFNVALVVIFTKLMTGTFIAEVAEYVSENSGMLGRAFFAGICTGLSSAVAFKIDSSAGGFDIVSYYISMKKSTLAGKYNVIINAFILSSFAFVKALSGLESWSHAFAGIWFSLVYLLTVMLVIDVINVRNKKAQIQIVTTNKDLPKLLLANIPHGATLVNGKGVYSGTDRYIIYVVVSTTEVKKAIKIIKQLDPTSFVNVTALQQVYGNFHMSPIK